MKKLSFTILLLCFVLCTEAQFIVTDLYGFRIGQYRETATYEFGNPFQRDKYDDGFEYESFWVKDSSLYLTFEYSKAHTDLIWSIQIAGTNSITDIGFKNLKLGIPKSQVEKILGTPTSKEDIGEYGERWNYSNTNYSIEISPKGKLSSVKIRNTYAGSSPDAGKIPLFKVVAEKLHSGTNAEIAELLDPGVEIYDKNKTLFFQKSLKTETQTDYSHIFTTIRKLTASLSEINTSDSSIYEENMRLTLGEDPKHVVKIKKGSAIKEIVFVYSNGKYVIWEINAK